MGVSDEISFVTVAGIYVKFNWQMVLSQLRRHISPTMYRYKNFAKGQNSVHLSSFTVAFGKFAQIVFGRRRICRLTCFYVAVVRICAPSLDCFQLQIGISLSQLGNYHSFALQIGCFTLQYRILRTWFIAPPVSYMFQPVQYMIPLVRHKLSLDR